MMNYATMATMLLLLLSGQTVNSRESSPEPTPVTPIAIEQGYLEGRGLTRVNPSEFDGENVTRDEDFTSDSYTHAFYTGKIFVAVYEAGPGRVYIDGALYDEFVHVLEGASYSRLMVGMRSSSSKASHSWCPKGIRVTGICLRSIGSSS